MLVQCTQSQVQAPRTRSLELVSHRWQQVRGVTSRVTGARVVGKTESAGATCSITGAGTAWKTAGPGNISALFIVRGTSFQLAQDHTERTSAAPLHQNPTATPSNHTQRNNQWQCFFLPRAGDSQTSLPVPSMHNMRR